MNKAIFLDRDGVLNEAIIKNNLPYPPASVEETVIPGDAFPALTILKQWGFLLICVTNQPDVVRGKTTMAIVNAINQELKKALPLDDILVCFHDDIDNCACRKPMPGLLISASQKYNIDLNKSFMIGDRWRDIEAGSNAGCQTILLQQGYDEKTPRKQPDYITHSLSLATNWISKRIGYESFHA